MTDWDARYLAHDTPWDKGKEAPAIREILTKTDVTGCVWVPGAGIGHDARFLAKALPLVKVEAYDISETAVNRAREFETIDNLTFEHADIFQLPPDRICDTWIEHTCYCAIPPSMRNAYAKAAATHIRQGGVLAGVFFISNDADPAEGPPHFSSEGALLECFTPYFDLIDSWEPKSCFTGREGEEKVFVFRKRSS